MTLHLAIYDNPTGVQIGEYAPRASDLSITTNEHGFESCSVNLRLSLNEAFKLYDRPGLPHLVITDETGIVVWEGRLEDVTLTPAGVQLTALGYWRAMADIPYTALWSSTTVDEWRPITTLDRGAGYPEERHSFDFERRVLIAPNKGTTYSTGFVGSATTETPNGSARTFATFSFDYEVLLPVTWVVRCLAAARDWSSASVLWTLNASGALQTGSQSLTTGAFDRLDFQLYYNNAVLTNHPNENGDNYAQFTNLRAKTTTASTVLADAIAAALATYVNGVNSTQISSSAALIQSPALDLRDELYEDEYPADILTRLARLGDNQTPPRQWEVGVWGERRLHLRPRGSAAVAWYVDATDLQLQRSLESLTNSVYPVYEDAGGGTVRGVTSADSASVSRYGLTRRAALSVSTTSATQANVQRDMLLQDRKDPLPRASISFSAVYDAGGVRRSLYAIRSGDTITIRNLPPALSSAIDKIRTFRISRTDYRADDDTIQVEPEAALPSLETLLARQQEGF